MKRVFATGCALVLYKPGVATRTKSLCCGCSSGKRMSTAHAVTCAIRLFASARGVRTCANCRDYGCETLKGFLAFAPVLKDKLEAIRKEIGK